MRVLGVIPARYASTRFPAKPLVMIHGKSMIQRVYEQALKTQSLGEVVVATDDMRIFEHVVGFGGKVMMTDESHQSGTDRCAEVMSKSIGLFDAVVNIQGDEPFIQPEQIDKLVAVLARGAHNLATLAKKMTELDAILNPNVVKVVFSETGKAIYFSRSPIPYLRNTPQYEWPQTGAFFKHIGLYAYRTETLLKIAQLAPSRLEKWESLEQLRWLEAGYSIGVAETDLETLGVDTPEDLAKIEAMFSN